MASSDLCWVYTWCILLHISLRKSLLAVIHVVWVRGSVNQRCAAQPVNLSISTHRRDNLRSRPHYDGFCLDPWTMWIWSLLWRLARCLLVIWRSQTIFTNSTPGLKQLHQYHYKIFNVNYFIQNVFNEALYF